MENKSANASESETGGVHSKVVNMRLITDSQMCLPVYVNMLYHLICDYKYAKVPVLSSLLYNVWMYVGIDLHSSSARHHQDVTTV